MANEEKHGIDVAIFVNGTPTLVCCCGFIAQGETWEEAGAELDDHLEVTAGGE